MSVAVQALIGILRTDLASHSVAFGDGVKPKDATTRYVVAWFEAGTVEDRSLRSRDGLSAVGTFHCYGPTPESARYANDALTESILGLAGQVTGDRVLLTPSQLTSLPLQRDDDLSPPLFDVVSQWRFRTSPA